MSTVVTDAGIVVWKFRVMDFGPLTVGIDSHGGSVCHDVQTEAKRRPEGILAGL